MKKSNDINMILDEEDKEYLLELETRFNLQKINETKRLNPIKRKRLTHKKQSVGNNPSQAPTSYWLNKNEIEEVRKTVGIQQVKIAVRSCLTCGTNFESEGSHNRVCDCCRKENGFTE